MTKSFFNQAIYIFVSSQSILCSCLYVLARRRYSFRERVPVQNPHPFFSIQSISLFSSAFSSLSLDFLFPSPLSSSRYSPLPRVTSSLLSSSLYCILSLFSTIYCLYELFFPCIVLLLQLLVAFL
jgi:hypothetical protein